MSLSPQGSLGGWLVAAGGVVLVGCQLLSGGIDLHVGESASGGGVVGAGGAGGEGDHGGEGGCGPDNPQRYDEVVRSDCPIAYFRLGDSCDGMVCTAANEIQASQFGTYKEMDPGGYLLEEPGALSGDSNTAVFVEVDNKGHVDVVPPINFPNGAHFSLELWFQPAQEAVTGAPNSCDAMGLISYDGEGCDEDFPGYRLVLNNQCNFELEMVECLDTGPNLKREFRSPPIANQVRWYHVVATYDGNMPLVYVDGVEDTAPDPGPLPILTPASYPLAIGARRGGMWGHADGWLDEVAIYDEALPAARIVAHYAAGIMTAP